MSGEPEEEGLTSADPSTTEDPVVRSIAGSIREAEAEPRQVEQAMQMAFGQSYQGPHPSPEQVRNFNIEQPGLGTRIVEDYLLQREHERRMEQTHAGFVNEDFKRIEKDRGERVSGLNKTYLFLAFLSSLAAYFGYRHQDKIAITLISPAVFGVVGVLIRSLFSGTRATK